MSQTPARPRIAVVHGTLRVPPTYFTVEQSVPLRDRYDFGFFALAAEVARPIPFPLTEAIGLRGRPFRQREVLIPLGMGRLSRLIRRFGPDLVHQQFGTWSTPAQRASERGSVPLLATLHGSDVFTTGYAGRDPRYAWHRANVRGLFERADRILCVSRFLADAAVAAGAPPDRVDVHYQGVDTDFLTPSATRPADQPPQVLYVGRLAAYKGIPDLVRASLQLAARGREHRLVLVGAGPLQAELQAAAAEHPHLRVVGPLDRAGVREKLREARVLALPSTPREAAGLVLLEAQACGVPVVAYDSGGKPEMLSPGVTGLLAEHGSVESLAAALQEVLELDGVQHAAMADRAREFVVANRSIVVCSQRLGEHYAELVG